jgi:hypothetical protein
MGVTREVGDTEDRVILAESRVAPLVDSLRLLDGVAKRGGAQAKAASEAARSLRLGEITRRIESKAWKEAIGLVDHWFPNAWKADAQVSELRARAQEVELAQCPTVSCRWVAARSVVAASLTPERTAQVTAARASVVESLTFTEQPAEQPLSRLARLRTLGASAAEALKVADGDQEVADLAVKAAAFAVAERAKTPLVGSSEAVVSELIAPLTPHNEKVSSTSLPGVAVYAVFDKQRVCRGVYAVGPAEGSRGITSDAWSGQRLLSQAVGRKAALKPPASANGTVSRWVEAGVGVVARWRSGTLIELRIGDAAP